MKIRKLKNKDREKIIKILKETDMFTEEEINVATELIDEFLAKDEESGYEIYTAVDDADNPTGYICFGKRPLTQGTYDIYWIAVEPSLQGNGIGKNLMKFTEQKIKEKGGTLILVETSSQEKYLKTRLFYKSCGYEEVARIKDFYKVGDNLIIFAKYI
ncbi:aminoglycoside 6'-N-acetyltransferase I [Candidatus Kryptobacter tengchongensis]|uniref:GNAT family N-acetyltransferase n=1 Tax=Kryptobacter tengchongensis TaxID=1643429 RepID=UPI00070848A5|nr:GNAT family N-acetyltransferase [Candidatus Kryptobacter tengchongensis]CUS87896.1 aminoglycoside 6'-N-acetyltransferase I [Candidatus Kryptobacter tengchongensis]CUU05304.1 aminoglycoside 6'-N-acetyltransferase I [Candidatus Kryptobacter tengchongensis]